MMKINHTLSRQALMQLVAIPLALELAFFGAVTALVERSQTAAQAEAHACAVTAHANALFRYLLQIVSLGAVYHLSSSGGFQKKVQGLIDQVAQESLVMEDLVKDSPQERESYEKMKILNGQCMNSMKVAQAYAIHGDTAGATKAFAVMQEQTNKLLEATDQLIKQQSLLQKSGGEAAQDSMEKLNLLLLVGTALSILLVSVAASSFNRSTSNRLKVLMDNTIRLASRRPLNPQVGGTDEIAQLDQFFRVMASTLEESVRKETAAANNALDVICSIDADGKITAMNPSSSKVFGYGAEDMLGTRISQIVYSEDVNQTLENIRQAIGQQTVQIFDNRIIRRDGTLVEISWSVYWSPDEKSLFCMATDITERKEMDRRKKEFIGLISNDLKTPLLEVDEALSRLGTRGNLSEGGANRLRMAEDNVQRLIGLVNNLLDVEQMESGKLELHHAPASVATIIERSVRSVLGFAQQRRIAVEAAPTASAVTIQADEEKLVQVVVNLLSNAIKFSPKDGSVAVTFQDEADWVKVMVTDSGRGVPVDLKEAIFERFKQVDASDERVKGGSGLGLAICKAIVEKHGGTIGVESNIVNGEQIGSNFWFRVPKEAHS